MVCTLSRRGTKLFNLLADTSSANDLLPIFSSVSSVGFAVWYGGYTVMYLIPGLQKKNDDLIDQVTKRHDETVRQLLIELKETRLQFEAWRSGRDKP